MAKLLQFKSHEGYINTYVHDETNYELGYINNTTKKYITKPNIVYSPSDLYKIADKITDNPPRQELFEAHRQLLDRNKKLRIRISELMNELDKDASYLTVSNK